MNKEDLEFLKELQHEMNTQDTCYQANPRFWVVMQTVREYGINEDYGISGTVIISCDGEENVDANNMNDIYNWLVEEFDIDCEFNGDWIHIVEDDEDLYDIEDVIDYVNQTLSDRYSLVNYRENEQIVENTFFLTKRECEEHIRANYYHYNNPKAYAMTAWRSPQVERLYKILQETDWDELINNNENELRQLNKTKFNPNDTYIKQIDNSKKKQFFEEYKPPYYFKTEQDNNVCDKCNCNPKNGGSGNCNCILGNPKIMS